MKEGIVFVDASAWIAVFYPKDQHHKTATEIYRYLIKTGALLLVTNWVMYEALSYVRSHAHDGYTKAKTMQAVFDDANLVRKEAVTQEIEEQAVGIFWKFKDKDWGVVDCSSLVVMALTNCRRAFGFDRHFVEAAKQFGFSLER